jgi:hypothetical protein
METLQTREPGYTHAIAPVIAGCSERPSSKAAASEEVKRTLCPYVEPLSVARTPLADFLNSLLAA